MDEFTGVLTILLLFGGPLFLAGIIGAVWLMNANAKRSERERARQTYERLMRDKLDVIKTALAMDFSNDELGYLDKRLENLIGTEQMRTLLLTDQPQVPISPEEIKSSDIQQEFEGIQRMKKEKGPTE